MRIGIIGSGRIGATVAHLLVCAGHEVAIANSRGPESLSDVVSDLGGVAAIAAESVADAAAFGAAVLVAIPLHAVSTLPADAFDGKVVIDANNYYPGRDGDIAALDDDSKTSSELLAAQLPGAHVVKAFNTMFFETLAGEGMPDAPRQQRLALFVAADDAAAKQLVSGLVEELGFAAIDTGTLADSRIQQPGGAVYNRPLNGAEAEVVLAAARRP
jgi:predicted dinucleotide-binding enzyme